VHVAPAFTGSGEGSDHTTFSIKFILGRFDPSNDDATKYVQASSENSYWQLNLHKDLVVGLFLLGVDPAGITRVEIGCRSSTETLDQNLEPLETYTRA
jgi:hypothetical protein